MKRSLWVSCLALSSLLFVGGRLLFVSDDVPLLPQEEISPLDAPFSMPAPQRPEIPSARFDIREFGAEEGGVVKNTDAIKRAIEAAAHRGGGNVVIPPGRWLTGAITLDDNINLYVSKGAELLFSQDPRDYLPPVFSRHEDVECYKYSAFIYANGKTNIAISGEGTLNGQGKPWWHLKQQGVERVLNEMAAKDIPVKERVFDGAEGRELRPAFFQPMRCRNVLVEGVTFLYGAFWTITPTYCEKVIIRKVRIVTEGPYGHTPNGDGVDPSSCRDVLIEDCDFDTGDDCVALKAGRDQDGLRVGLPTENVVIRNCRGLRGHGGIVIGSETSGGIRNVYGVNCRFNGTDRIVRIKTTRGRGGVLENMWFRHLSADTIAMEGLHINMLYTGTRFPEQSLTASTPTIRNIHFEDITCTYARTHAIELLGLPEKPIENVTFDRIRMGGAKGIACTDVSKIMLHDVDVITDSWPAVIITDGAGIRLSGMTVPVGADPFLSVRGSRSRDIQVLGTASSSARRFLSLGDSASAQAVSVEE